MPGEWNRATFQIDAPGQSHDQDTILTSLNSFMTQSGWERPSWDDGNQGPGANGESFYWIRSDRNTQSRWQFNGDVVIKHGGIRAWYDDDPEGTTGLPEFSGLKHIVIQSFLENSTATGVEVATPDHVGSVSGIAERFGSIRILFDNLAVNTWFIYGGEDGVYIEVGRDGEEANLGHGMILTFDAIPDLHGTLDAAVDATAQGLVCDLFGNCRFTADRSDRFVANDGTDKNFSASLQPYSPRGTINIDTVSGNVFDQRAYYIASRDNLWATGSGTDQGASSAIVEAVFTEASAKYAATFGLINSPKNNRFRLSPLHMLQDMQHWNVGRSDVSSANNGPASGDLTALLDVRVQRQILRVVAADYTLLPFVNVVDAVTGATYRIGRMDDAGRFSQFGVEVPTTPPLTI